GVVLLEAMAAGTPIVASNLPGYRNVASPGQHALMVTPGDAEALAGALSQVLGDARLGARLASAGQERARHFGMDELVQRYLELYEAARRAFSGRT
ncbi:MAG TPA: glycosyltransferase, partial [Acidimicrobiales bacterium]|nr:glycosyltransferase [Acidimicrobiales bacterium]